MVLVLVRSTGGRVVSSHPDEMFLNEGDLFFRRIVNDSVLLTV